MPRVVTSAPQDGRPPLRVTQARVLAVLYPEYPEDSVSEWPVFTRAQLCKCVGFKPTSGSLTRVMNGIRVTNMTSGPPHPGLVELGMVEILEIDIDGVTEINYRITHAGVVEFQRYVEIHGELPPLKDAALCINDRYKEDSPLADPPVQFIDSVGQQP